MLSRYIYFDSVDTHFQTEELGPPGPNEIVIRSTCSLISVGTERATLQGIILGPGRLGYSLVGRVEDVGSQIQEFTVGDRVTTSCHHADYVKCTAEPWVVQSIPAEVSDRAAAFTVLASVAAHAVERAELHIDEGVLIAGAGVVGLIASQLAQIMGAYPVIVTDIRPEPLEMAKRVGVKNTIHAESDEELRSGLEAIAPNESISVLIEACGSPQAVRTLVSLAPSGARVVVAGALSGELLLPDPFDAFMMREISIIGAFQPNSPLERQRYHPWSQSDNRAMALRLMAEDRLIVEPLITHVIAAEDLPSFYADLKSGALQPTGAIINWRG